MASISFTLAALATSAVPGLAVTGVADLEEDPDFSSAVIETDRGRAIVRVPVSAAAEVKQSAEMLGLAALSEGARAVMGFAAPEVLGITRAGETRAVVFTRLPGEQLTPYDLVHTGPLLSEVAQMLSAIHDLPHSAVLQGGLPSRDARECRISAARVLERAEATRLLPETVLQRWEKVMSNDDIWDFATTVVHGSLETDVIYVEEERIVGVDGWFDLSIGDPALDLSWLIEIDPEVFEAVIPRYSRLHSTGSLPALRTRAQLYQELKLAQQLLQGVEQHDQAKVDGSITELDQLVDLLSMHPGEPEPTSSAEQLDSILASTPDVVDRLSETAAQEALDEDRMFGFDTDFIDPLSGEAEDPGASVSEPSESSAAGLSGFEEAEPSVSEPPGDPEESDDHATEPIADENLPENDRD